MLNIFNKKKDNKLEPSPYCAGGTDWWQTAKELFKKDTGGTIDKNDPEYNAQKIYQHWLKSYL